MDEATRKLVASALTEDIGEGDLTSEAIIPSDARARARISRKQPGVVFGLEVAGEAFAQAGAHAFEPLVAEGEWRDSAAEVARVSGPARALLGAERTALNFLCHLSGIATLTARFVAATAAGGVTILDTRKTTPGLRALEKAAVAAGGGRNHRMGLDDAILIKENHIVLAGGVTEAIERVGRAAGGREIEVECRTLADVSEAIAAGADRLLLDNMTPAELRAAASQRNGSQPTLEASGGVTLENVAELATTGVDAISIGALTHSAPALDLSLLLEPLEDA